MWRPPPPTPPRPTPRRTTAKSARARASRSPSTRRARATRSRSLRRRPSAPIRSSRSANRRFEYGDAARAGLDRAADLDGLHGAGFERALDGQAEAELDEVVGDEGLDLSLL